MHGDPSGRRVGLALVAFVAVALLAVAAFGRAVPATERTPSGSPAPVAGSATIPPGCVAVDPVGEVPSLHLGATDPIGVRGLLGTVHRPDGETPGRGWQVPGPELALETVSRTELRLIPSVGVCIRYVDAVAAAADPGRVPGQTERLPLLTVRVDPPRDDVRLGSVPDGDWVVRVIVRYWTGPDTGIDREVWTETYFRVRVGDPVPTTEPAPTVPAALADFEIPTATIGRPTDDRRITVLPGCGLSLSFDGYAAVEECGSIGFPAGLDVLTGTAGEDLVLEIPGWTILRWSIACGEGVGVPGEAQQFVVRDGCTVLPWTTWGGDWNGARFTLPAGEFAIRMQVTAERGGVTFTAAFYGYAFLHAPP